MNPPSAPRPNLAAPAAKRSPVSQVLGFLSGWIVIPALVLAAFFGLGVHCGATQPQGAPERWVLVVSDWWTDWTPPIAAPSATASSSTPGDDVAADSSDESPASDDDSTTSTATEK